MNRLQYLVQKGAILRKGYLFSFVYFLLDLIPLSPQPARHHEVLVRYIHGAEKMSNLLTFSKIRLLLANSRRMHKVASSDL
jgi:hypothetical protein